MRGLFLLAIGLLAACSTAPTGAVPQKAPAAAQKQWFLYVGNSRGSLARFTVYPRDGSRPIRSFRRSWNVYAMKLDPWNDVYTTDENVYDTAVTAYTPGAQSVLVNFSVGFGSPLGLAFDKHGNVWVADTVNIVEYAARSNRLLRTVNVRLCYAVAVDSSGDLYAACGGNKRKDKIEVFPYGASKPFRSITQGIDNPSALMFDRSGNLFVANCSPCESYGKKHGGSITVYAPGSGVPSRTITNGIDWPVAMAFDGDDGLAVANAPWLQQGSVTVYGSGSQPTHTITDGIASPNAIAVDPRGTMYVSNIPVDTGKHFSITVYGAGGSLLRKITDGVRVPTAIAVGSD